MNKDDTNEHTKLNGEKPMRPQSYPKNYRQLRKTGSRKGGPPKERAHPFIIDCPAPKVNPDNIHTK